MPSSSQKNSPLHQAERLLLTPYDLAHTDLEHILGGIMARRVDYADLYFQYARYESWSLDEGIVKAGSFNIDQGVGVRAVSGEKTAFAYSDDIRLSALEDAAASVRAIGAAGQDGRTGSRVSSLSPQILPPPLYAGADPLASLPAAAKVELLERLEAFARAEDSRVTQVMGGLAGEWEVVLVAGSDGRLAADVRPLVRVSVSVIIEENGRREQGSAGGGGRFDYSYFTDALLKDFARQAVHQAVINLDARPAPAGQMTVVLGPGWPGILLHEAVGHGLEGDFRDDILRVGANGRLVDIEIDVQRDMPFLVQRVFQGTGGNQTDGLLHFAFLGDGVITMVVAVQLNPDFHIRSANDVGLQRFIGASKSPGAIILPFRFFQHFVSFLVIHVALKDLDAT
ncbi:hypothetical protein AGMMS49545_07590 [Betaproteobacteria bacterium]|nr:hypothetical protein AGMMS49545_07590 [Betaproteobacteria bacterium]